MADLHQDCVYRHRGHGDASGSIGMVSMDWRVHVLPMEGLQEIRALDRQRPGSTDIDRFPIAEVSASP